MLERLRKLNPNIKFYSVEDEEFSTFGRVIRDFDASEIIKAAEEIIDDARKPETCGV